MQRGEWKLALLCLLIAGGLPGSLVADSPKWADEQMLVVWPDALGPTLPEEVDPSSANTPDVESADTRTGQVSLSDYVGHSVTSAEWQEPAPAVESPPHTEIQTTGIEHILPGHSTRLSCTGCDSCTSCDCWQILPAGILYKSYIAGEKEPRMGAAWLVESDRGSVLEEAIGGRLGLLRHGTVGPINPQGFQWDLEAAALLRQDPELDLDVEATDFRIGSVLTWREGPTAAKFGYYHLSSHVGDEFLLRNPTFQRVNYVRDSLLAGVHHSLRPDLAVYGEIAYAFGTDGGAEPIELQFGVEYTGVDATSRTGAPFCAVNGHLREEFDFGGSVNVLAGWEWRGSASNRRLRIGGQYYNGKEIQWSFFDESVSFTGIGIWYDF